MHIKFARHRMKQKSAVALARYLLRKSDNADKARAAVKVLRGDPLQVGRLADSLLAGKSKLYTHGIIAWAPEDKPAPTQIDQVLDSVERLAYAGLDPARSGLWAAVRHDDANGGCHVHLLFARVELQTGKVINVAPPGWQKTFDPLRDLYNYRYGWARPDDPARAKLTRNRDWRDRPVAEIRQDLGDHLQAQVAAHVVRSREEFVQAISELNGFEVVRQGDDYVSVRVPGRGPGGQIKRGAI